MSEKHYKVKESVYSAHVRKLIKIVFFFRYITIVIYIYIYIFYLLYYHFLLTTIST